MSDSAGPDPRRELLAAMGSLWWLPLIRGILLAILGFYALIKPGMSIAVLAQVVGIFVIADGALCIVVALMGGVSSRLWIIARGVLEILVGLLVFANPIVVAGITATVLVYMLAFSAILSGVIEIVVAIQDRKRIEGEGWIILSGIFLVLFGIVVMIAPLAFGLFMVRIIGGFAILSGISLVVFSFRIRGLGK